jgi:hypothetical protein
MARKRKPKHVYLLAAARKIWFWGPERAAAIEKASKGPDLVECQDCRKLVPKELKIKGRKQFAVDHIEPVVLPGRAFPSLELEVKTGSSELLWDDYLRRLMYGALQVLCLDCHQKKTNAENNERKQKRSRMSQMRTGPERSRTPSNRGRGKSKG